MLSHLLFACLSGHSMKECTGMAREKAGEVRCVRVGGGCMCACGVGVCVLVEGCMWEHCAYGSVCRLWWSGGDASLPF